MFNPLNQIIKRNPLLSLVTAFAVNRLLNLDAHKNQPNTKNETNEIIDKNINKAKQSTNDFAHKIRKYALKRPALSFLALAAIGTFFATRHAK